MIDETGELLGTMPRAKALWLAQWKWLDLVQIAYDPKTKICKAKIIDFGKHQYETKKAESEKRKKQKAKLQKEIKFGYNIGDHDLDLKVKKWIEFLQKWHPLKVNVVLRWREKMYKDIVRIKLDGVEEQLKEYGKTQWVKHEAQWFSLVVMATKQWQAKKKTPKKEKKTNTDKKKENIPSWNVWEKKKVKKEKKVDKEEIKESKE